MPLLTPIKLNVAERLQEDKEFRRGFFHSQVEDDIASSIRSLRKLRNKRQTDLATEAGMKQSAISRIEQADYGNWSLNTLFRVADALDARLCISFDPIEEVVAQYKDEEPVIQPKDQRTYYRGSDANGIVIYENGLKETKDSQALVAAPLGAI